MTLADFLTFRTMITPSVLLLVYYFGAVVMPLLAYALFRKIYGKKRAEGEENPPASSGFRWSWKLRLLFLFFFFMGELAWRIFIEFFVAYFQMREALLG